MTNGPLPSPPELGPSSRILSSDDGRPYHVLVFTPFIYLFYFCFIYGTSQARDPRSFMLTSHFISRQVSSRALSATARWQSVLRTVKKGKCTGSDLRSVWTDQTIRAGRRGSRLVLSTETVTSSCIRLCQSTDYLSAAHPAPSRQLFTRPAPRDGHR